jgi:hypothetical protein
VTRLKPSLPWRIYAISSVLESMTGGNVGGGGGHGGGGAGGALAVLEGGSGGGGGGGAKDFVGFCGLGG